MKKTLKIVIDLSSCNEHSIVAENFKDEIMQKLASEYDLIIDIENLTTSDDYYYSNGCKSYNCAHEFPKTEESMLRETLLDLFNKLKKK